MKVFKFQFDIGEVNQVVPAGSQILHAGMQHNVPQLWVLMTDSDERETIKVFMVGTGRALGYSDPARVRYINTFKSDSEGTYIFHAFEVLP